MGRSPPPASGGGCAEEGNRAAVEVGRQDGPAGHRPADTAGARVAAAGQESGPLAEADRGVAARRPAVDREAGPAVAAAVGWAGLPAHCTPLRCGAEERGENEGGLRAPQRASRRDDGGRLRGNVGRPRRAAVQGQVPGGNAAVLERVLRQGVPDRAARVAARRYRVRLPLFRGRNGSRRPR